MLVVPNDFPPSSASTPKGSAGACGFKAKLQTLIFPENLDLRETMNRDIPFPEGKSSGVEGQLAPTLATDEL